MCLDKCNKLLTCLFVAFFLFSFPVLSFADDDEENVCVSCHLEQDDILLKVAQDWQQSVHAEAGVFCQDCHGGNPYDSVEAMEKSSGFKGKPKKMDIPKLCAKCHADRIKMRSHNLPSDEYAKYSSSVHGKQVMAGNKNAPTCIDCHGQHKILRPADPESTVNRQNIVDTCSGCHSNEKKMAGSSLPNNQRELYKKSKHGKLYMEGDKGVPTCIDCHNKHDISKPQNIETRTVCGKCHTEQDELYKDSAHWTIAKMTGSPTCVSCHSNHSILTPVKEKFVTAGELNCANCHEKGSGQSILATDMYKAFKSAETSLELVTESEKSTHEWSGSGFETSHLAKKVRKVGSILKEMKVLFHGLELKTVQKKSEDARKLSREVMKEIDDMASELSVRKKGLAATYIVALIFCIALSASARRFRR